MTRGLFSHHISSPVTNLQHSRRALGAARCYSSFRSSKGMSSAVDAAGEPIPTSAVLMAAAKHIAARCRAENVAFINCKKKDPNPEKCLEKGRQVTSCVLNLLKELHQKCPKEMDAYAGCMYYYTNEFDLCRKEQQEFEKACPISE